MTSNHPLEQGVQELRLFGLKTLLEQPTAELTFERGRDSVA